MKPGLLISERLSDNNFDAMRFALASSVILCHCYAIYYGYEQFVLREPFMKWSQGQISIGSVAVNGFFVISGFLITASWMASRGPLDFLKRRLLRIYPGFVVAFALSVLLFAPLGHGAWQAASSWWNYLAALPLHREAAHLISLQAPDETLFFTHLPQRGLNNSLWTIQYEMLCYLLLPLLAGLGMLRWRHGLLLVLVLAYCALLIQHSGMGLAYSPSWSHLLLAQPWFYPRFFTWFVLGAVAYRYREFLPRHFALALLALALAVFAFASGRWVEPLLPLAGAYLVFYTAYHPRLQWPGFSRYGDFSYGIYLYGWPLQQLMMGAFWPHLSPWRFFAAVFPLILLFAWLSWRLIEAPALRLKKQSLRRYLGLQGLQRAAGES